MYEKRSLVVTDGEKRSVYILKHNVKWKRENFTFTISQFITHMDRFSVKQCPCLSSAAATLMNAPQTNVSPVCYHPCWTLTNPLASFTLQLLFFAEVIGKHPFTARLHTPIQNVASPSTVQAQFAQYFNSHECRFLLFLCILSSDTVHTARAVRILLLPLDIIAGQTLLGTNTTGKTHRYTQGSKNWNEKHLYN